MRARDSGRLASRAPAPSESDARPSLRLRVLTAYFTVFGTIALLAALVFAVLAVRDSPDVAALGPHSTEALALLFASGIVWLVTGFTLSRRRRVGALLALAAFALPAMRWISGAPIDIEELVVVVIGMAII